MTRTIEIAGTTIVVTLTRDAAARTWRATWQQFDKPREFVTWGNVSDVMSAVRLSAAKIENEEGDEPVPSTERVT